MVSIRVLIAGQALIAEGFRQILKESFLVVGTSPNRREAIASTEALRPDILVIDADLAEPDGVDVLQEVRTSSPNVRIVLVSRRTHSLALRRAMSMGAAGLVLMQQPARDLTDAIRAVAKGGIYIAPLLQATFPWARRGHTPEQKQRRSTLTPRQREVLQFVADGRTNKQIAALLCISVKTVEFHRAALMQELGLRTVAELSRFALQSGLVGPLD